METDKRDELKKFFDALPRPLPKRLKIYPGEFVENVDVMFDSPMHFINSNPPHLTEVFVTRLKQWKKAYLHFITSNG